MSNRSAILLARVVFYYRLEAICQMTPSLGEKLVDHDQDFEQPEEYDLELDLDDVGEDLSAEIVFESDEEQAFRAIAAAHQEEIEWLYQEMRASLERAGKRLAA